MTEENTAPDAQEALRFTPPFAALMYSKFRASLVDALGYAFEEARKEAPDEASYSPRFRHLVIRALLGSGIAPATNTQVCQLQETVELAYFVTEIINQVKAAPPGSYLELLFSDDIAEVKTGGEVGIQVRLVTPDLEEGAAPGEAASEAPPQATN